jgi:glycyl-tRNA synthetase
MKQEEVTYNELMELFTRKSFIYPSAEVYPNSPRGFWDFGPVGQSIRRKIIRFWIKEWVNKEDMFEIYGSQILPRNVFEGSGHVKSFADPIVSCIKCKKYERADKFLTEKLGRLILESAPLEELNSLIKKNNLKCEKCGGDFGEVTKFSLMVESIVGKQGDIQTFLRPEACQTIFLSFLRMMKTMRLKLPKGIAQAGGAFRNEISPRQSVTRAIEFTQMESEVFFDPDDIDNIGDKNFDDVKDYKIKCLLLGKDKVEDISSEDLIKKKIVPGKIIAYYLAKTQQLWNKMGIPLGNMRFREVDKDERAFYSLVTFDFEVKTCIGWLELIANNYRTNYDIEGHMKKSGTNMEFIKDNGIKLIPHIWETSSGVDRTMFALLSNVFCKEKNRIYLKIPPRLSPYHCAVLPLIKKDKLEKLSKKIKISLIDNWFDVSYDSSGSIGRRYARQDEIGTPFCITIDFETLENNSVTIRDRDSTNQIRVEINKLNEILKELIEEKIEFKKI